MDKWELVETLNLMSPTKTCAESKVLSAPLPVSANLRRLALVPQRRRRRSESRPGSSRSRSSGNIQASDRPSNPKMPNFGPKARFLRDMLQKGHEMAGRTAGEASRGSVNRLIDSPENRARRGARRVRRARQIARRDRLRRLTRRRPAPRGEERAAPDGDFSGARPSRRRAPASGRGDGRRLGLARRGGRLDSAGRLLFPSLFAARPGAINDAAV